MNAQNKKITIAAAIIAITGLFWLSHGLNQQLRSSYAQNQSAQITDRHGLPIYQQKNPSGCYNQTLALPPAEFTKLLLQKEDRYFYWHKGINPISILKNILAKFGAGDRNGASTITQQLAKILLKQENQRSTKNKLIEIFYTISLEFSNTKGKILNEYLNSIYLGYQIQGLKAASLAYFGIDPNLLTREQIMQLLATVSNPTNINPTQTANIAQAKLLAKNLNISISDNFTLPAAAKKNLIAFLNNNTPLFELTEYISDTQCNQQTTLDSQLNQKIRQTIQDNLALLNSQKAKNAATIVISLSSNEIISLIGSPDPQSWTDGYKINMLNQPRQIGSTIKPFIYLKGFEKGMRPYTLINDREYKYSAGQDFSIYPKNYDWQYRGLVTAHYALANSINVPAVKTLEFIGIDNFNKFLKDDLNLPAAQNFAAYQIGIALGAFETNLIELSRAFTLFPKNGQLNNLNLFTNRNCKNQYFSPQNKIIAKKQYVELVNKILADRKIAQDEFSSASNLNLPTPNYALKTGTSHDYTDSWVIGYTPDFLVAVWVGNADATAMEGLSGQLGAGQIWSDIMQIMLSSQYNHYTQFDFSGIQEYARNDNIEYGLKNDDYQKSQNLIESKNNSLILKPCPNDIFQFTPNTQITLQSKITADWQINSQYYQTAQETAFNPPSPGTYKITATANDQKEEIQITINPK